jgi:hypothetical protein
VLADLDHDGRQELILKNRNAPQLRILHNSMKDMHSIAFRLRGQKSNRDAIGTAVTISAGALRQTKYLQAGSGFLSQHSKELFFGLGKNAEAASATIRWPGGLTQTFDRLPANHRVEIQEGAQDFRATPFAIPPASYAQTGDSPKLTPLPSAVKLASRTLSSRTFPCPISGRDARTQTYRRGFVVLNFWATNSAASIDQVQLFQGPEVCVSIQPARR